MLRQARVPVICLSGHVHWKTLTTVDGIPHLTLQSLTESFTTLPASGRRLGPALGNTIAWTVHGRDPFFARIEAAETMRRWMTPLQPFHEHPELRQHRLSLAAE